MKMNSYKWWHKPVNGCWHGNLTSVRWMIASHVILLKYFFPMYGQHEASALTDRSSSNSRLHIALAKKPKCIIQAMHGWFWCLREHLFDDFIINGALLGIIKIQGQTAIRIYELLSFENGKTNIPLLLSSAFDIKLCMHICKGRQNNDISITKELVNDFILICAHGCF